MRVPVQRGGCLPARGLRSGPLAVTLALDKL